MGHLSTVLAPSIFCVLAVFESPLSGLDQRGSRRRSLRAVYKARCAVGIALAPMRVRRRLAALTRQEVAASVMMRPSSVSKVTGIRSVNDGKGRAISTLSCPRKPANPPVNGPLGKRYSEQATKRNVTGESGKPCETSEFLSSLRSTRPGEIVSPKFARQLALSAIIKQNLLAIITKSPSRNFGVLRQ